MSWLREAISDENHLADMAYVAIGALVLSLVSAVAFLCIMSAVAYARCEKIVDVGKPPDLVRAAIPCDYDPNPLGLSIAACIAAFGSPIGALAGYMVATRRRESKPEPISTDAAMGIGHPIKPKKGK